ncbi:IS3 family transposase [Bacillus sp. FJAT-49732]|uniref:IS3 family transposase n=1 Tax=Lederbergia citrisecunda TaxID=2833583 RepID=A0A942TQR3_9BACI|nr:IS3 family transposase [Lederbergia citrisecunda]
MAICQLTFNFAHPEKIKVSECQKYFKRGIAFLSVLFFIELLILEELKREIKEYMNYYNNHRYQWNLKKVTSAQ